MASGFRRSLARLGRRASAAIAIAAIVVPMGLVATPATTPAVFPAGRPVADVAHAIADPAADPAADLAAFDPVAAAAANAADADAAAVANGGLQPSIQYEEAERHAADRIDFAPGDRVTVGFRPRAGDTWLVGGGRPTALPAGRLDGRTIHRQGDPAGGHASRTPASVPPGGGASVDRAPDGAVDQPASATPPVDAAAAAFRDEAGTLAESQVVPAAAISANGLRREIFGFLPYWEVNSSSLRLDYAKISTIAYFGVGADGAGNLQKRNADGTTTVGWSGWTSAKLSSIITTAHANHTRVVLTVQSFGWNTSGLTRQKQLLGSSTARLNLARQIAAAVRDRGADGVNLDFEPLAATYDAEFTALVRTIRAELNKVHSGYQITFDTLGAIGNYPIGDATATGAADAVFVMGYDYRSAGSSPVGSIAPLDRAGYDIRETIAAYISRIMPSKVILGVPYYGRAWSTSSDVLHATNTSGAKFGDSTTVVYDTAADYLAQYGRRYDPAEGVAWTAYQRENCTATYGCVTSWRQLYVDDATAIAAKYDLVNAYGLRGAGIWALGYDGARPDLWAAIQRKFITDTTPPIAGIRTLPNTVINPGFSVAWAARDDVGVVSYDVQVSVDGGAWSPWQNATKAASAPWFGIDGHGYAFRVRARDPRGNTGPWNVTSASAAAPAQLAAGGFGLVRVDGLSIRSAPDTSATKVGTHDSGTIVAVVGGPRTADGYTWYQVRGPLLEWGAVSALSGPGWVVAGVSGSTWLSAAKAPNATRINAALGDLAFGNAGPASIGLTPSAASHRAVSPNGDGVGDTIAIDWTNDRALDRLILRVFRADGSLAGDVPLSQRSAGPHEIGWNGKVGSTVLPNGRYLATLIGTAAGATYYDPTPGFSPAALATFGVTIDTVAPVVSSATSTGSLLSPNDDGILDALTVRLVASGADRWTFSGAPSGGTPVVSASGSGGTAAVTWGGRSNGGAIVPDGLYRLTLTAFDAAGNRAARAWTVRVDRTPATLRPGASPALFSPNADGLGDTTRLTWTATETITGNARIYLGTTLIRSWTVTAAHDGAIGWNGTDTGGRAVPDGRYTFRIAGRDPAGNLAAATVPIVVDRTLAAVGWNRAAFYPQDGDGLVPTAAIAYSLKRSASVSIGIYSGTTLVRSVLAERTLGAGTYGWTWDGRDAKGAFVARGAYTARVTARSSIGTSVIARPIVADAFRTALSATTLRAGQTLTVTLTTTEGLRAAPSVTFSQPGRTAVTRTATSLGSGRYRVTFAIAAGSPGTATLRLTGRDSAGGLNTSSGSVTIR